MFLPPLLVPILLCCIISAALLSSESELSPAATSFLADAFSLWVPSGTFGVLPKRCNSASAASVQTSSSSALARSPHETMSGSSTKTVFLIRHAESEENNKLGSLKSFFKESMEWGKLKHAASLLTDESMVDS